MKKKIILIACSFVFMLMVSNILSFETKATDVQENESQHDAFLRKVQEIEQRIMEIEGNSQEEILENQKVVYANTTIADALGMDGGTYIDWLKSHQYDNYYLGTRYVPYDWRSPHGDISFNGAEGMNCTGFVWHALMKPTYQSGGNTDIIPGLSGWVSFYKQNNIQRQYFSSKSEMLTSGYPEKGDIIWIFDGNENTLSNYHHVGIYWGENGSDLWWHSLDGNSLGLDLPYDGNMLSQICSASSAPIYVVLKGGGVETPPSADKFSDNPVGAWYYSYVQDVFSKNIMTGLNEFYFGASENLARAQFAMVLYRMANSPEMNYNAPFPDVGDGLFYSVPVSWAKEYQIIGGYENGLFGPSDFITREQMVTMMYRYAKVKGEDVSQRGKLNDFPDGSLVNKFAQEAMSWAVAKGIVQGTGEGYLKPQGNINRAECATIISRYCEKVQ